MALKPRGRRTDSSLEPCCVCGMRDARALLPAVLASGERVILCGSHELMHRREGAKARTVAELCDAFGERRAMERRATGEVDELAASLTSAFTNERRTTDRRTAQ